MDRLTQLLQESYQTPRELTPPTGSWDRLAQDLAKQKRRRWIIWWLPGSLLVLGLSLFALSSSTPTLSTFPIAVTDTPAQAASTTPPSPLVQSSGKEIMPLAMPASTPALSLPVEKVVEPELSGALILVTNDISATDSFKNATSVNISGFISTPSTAQSAQQAPLAELEVVPQKTSERSPSSGSKQESTSVLSPDSNRISASLTLAKGNVLMEEAQLPKPPRQNVWRFFAGTQQHLDGIVLMTYTDYPLIRQQSPLKTIENTDLYALSFASGRKRTSYLEVGLALQRYHNERLSFNYQFSFFSGSYTSKVLEPYVRVNTNHYQETAKATVRALQAEYGIAWDWLRGPRLRLAPYAGLLYQFTLQSQYQSTLRIPGQSVAFATETVNRPPHITNELRLRLGALVHLPLNNSWEISVATGLTTEFLDVPRPAFYGNVGVGKAF